MQHRDVTQYQVLLALQAVYCG